MFMDLDHIYTWWGARRQWLRDGPPATTTPGDSGSGVVGNATNRLHQPNVTSILLPGLNVTVLDLGNGTAAVW